MSYSLGEIAPLVLSLRSNRNRGIENINDNGSGAREHWKDQSSNHSHTLNNKFLDHDPILVLFHFFNHGIVVISIVG